MLPIFMAEPIRDIRVIRGSHSFNSALHRSKLPIYANKAGLDDLLIAGGKVKISDVLDDSFGNLEVAIP